MNFLRQRTKYNQSKSSQFRNSATHITLLYQILLLQQTNTMGSSNSKPADEPVIEPNRKTYSRYYNRRFKVPANHVEFYEKYKPHGEVMYGIRDYHIDLLSSTTGIDAIEVCLNLVTYVHSFKGVTKSPEAYALYHGVNLALKHIRATNNELSLAVVRRLEHPPAKKRKQDQISIDCDNFTNSMNHYAMSQIINPTGRRPITERYATVCTGEKLTTSAMIGFSKVRGVYRDWKSNPQVILKINEMTSIYRNALNRNDPFMEKVKKFGIVWKQYYAQCRLPKPLKVATLNEFFIRFEKEVYGGDQLPEVFAKMITGDSKFLDLTADYNQTQRR